MKVFAYRKCNTCMKALKWLEVHNVEFEERAIKEENPHLRKCFLQPIYFKQLKKPDDYV